MTLLEDSYPKSDLCEVPSRLVSLGHDAVDGFGGVLVIDVADDVVALTTTALASQITRNVLGLEAEGN